MKKIFSILLICLVTSGCQTNNRQESEIVTDNIETKTVVENNKELSENNVSNEEQKLTDYSSIFNGVDGCAVFYQPTEGYYIYNEEECNTRYSPNSTFKIVAVLEGLRCGVLQSEETTMVYSGKKYPIEAWNGNLNLKEAFQASCVWYFRQVIDSIGQDNMQKALNSLSYGNCDISNWEGIDAKNNPDRSGFWLGSSLEISPMEQVKVLYDIFEGNTDYTSEQVMLLKGVMESETEGIYGKTGSGIDNSAWYVGFYENKDDKLYFAVHMQGDETQSIAGANAKAVAVEIINQHFKGLSS